MITVKDIAKQYYQTEETSHGQCAAIGRLLKRTGIQTVKISNITYIDVERGATATGITRRLKRKLAELRMQALAVEETEAGNPPSQDAEELKLPNAEPEPTPPLTLEKAILIIERMAIKLAEQDTLIASLREQLGAANNRTLSATVKNAMAVYGE